MRKALALTKFHFLSAWNWRSAYLGKFIEPIAFLAFLVVGLETSVQVQGGYAEFALAGIFAFVAFRAGTTAMSDVSNDRKWGIVAIHSLYGGNVPSYLLSILIYSSAIFAAQAVTLAILGRVLFAEGLNQVPVGLWIGMTLLLALGWVGFGAAVGGRVSSYAKRDLIVTLTALPVVLSAPLFYPVNASSSALLRFVPSLNPLTYQVGWVRSAESWLSIELLFCLLWALGSNLVAWVVLAGADRLSTER